MALGEATADELQQTWKERARELLGEHDVRVRFPPDLVEERFQLIDDAWAELGKAFGDGELEAYEGGSGEKVDEEEDEEEDEEDNEEEDEEEEEGPVEECEWFRYKLSSV